MEGFDQEGFAGRTQQVRQGRKRVLREPEPPYETSVRLSLMNSTLEIGIFTVKFKEQLMR